MSASEIKRWMRRNVSRFVDASCGEVNCTEMVEAWDREASTGSATLDADHIAWECAVDVAAGYEVRIAQERAIVRRAEVCAARNGIKPLFPTTLKGGA